VQHHVGQHGRQRTTEPVEEALDVGVDHPAGLQNAATTGELEFLCDPFVLGDQPCEDGPSLDPFVCQVAGWTVGSWGLHLQGPVWPSAVVVAGVFACSGGVFAEYLA
jgi:hypothetical protein